MGVFRFLLFLLIGSLSPAFAGDCALLKKRLDLLAESETAKDLLQKAKRKWGFSRAEDFCTLISFGEVSRTDSSIVRHFHSGGFRIEKKVSLLIKRDESALTQALDLVHELVHGLRTPLWDPYDPSLSVELHVRRGIEGRGGEVEALHLECQVAMDLAHLDPLSPAIRRCYRYTVSSKSPINKDRVAKDFYRVGRYMSAILKRLKKKHFPLLSSSTPHLVSSAADLPYPLALIREYDAVTHAACENSRNRLRSIQIPIREAPSKTIAFLSSRCATQAQGLRRK